VKNAPFSPPVRTPNYRIVDEKSVYQATWQGVPYEVFPTPENQNIVAQCVNQGFDLWRSGPWTFNWAVRRSPCSLISGDLPRMVLVETERSDTPNPPFIRMGDIRIRLTVGGDSFWLDERGRITTTYYPWGTVHHVEPEPDLPLVITVTAALARNSGMAVRVDVEGLDKKPVSGTIGIYYGGLDINGTQYWQEYVRVHSQGYPAHVPRMVTEQDTVTIEGDVVTLSNPQVPLGAAATALPVGKLERVAPKEWEKMNAVPREEDLKKRRVDEVRDEHRVVFSFDFDTKTPVEPVRFLAWKVADGTAPLAIERFDDYLAEARQYYAGLLDTVEIDTPDTHLNTAFNAAVVNMDYVYEAPAWFEGVHEWNGYFSDNYQISAAMALGQLDRAREALLYFGEHPNGPGGVFAADASGEGIDGVTYYILQLYRYWKATGDDDTLRRVWSNTCRNFEQLLRVRDPDGDMLLNWHAGCNVFLYQADHLSLPGAAASPSIFATGMLDWMAEMAGELASCGAVPSSDPEALRAKARQWRRRSAYMRREIVRRLWLQDEGRFTSAIDSQGLVQCAAYYTDFVFPILYSQLPREYALKSLEALDRTLWIGDHLLRTGNYKPDYFGNNAVHPTAMCEGAEAYFKAGRADRGWALLHGTALSATVLTDSPGAFPEYCTTTGYGLPDWLFGNDIGTYIRAVVGGLFGFERTAPGRTLSWSPCFPARWERARLRLGDIVMSAEGRAGHRRYELRLPAPQPVCCKLPLFGHRIDSVVDARGNPIPYESDGIFLTLHLPAGTQHTINIRSTAVAEPEPAAAAPEEPAYEPPAIVPGRRRPVDLTRWFNADQLESVNHGAPCKFDFSNDIDDRGVFAIGDTEFHVRPTGENMVKIEVGFLTRNVDALSPTTAPDALTIPVGDVVKGVEFLLASECRCRLTHMTVGGITLRYADGTETVEPLIVGRNVDCSQFPFAQSLHRRTLTCDIVSQFPISPGAFALPADPTRPLASVEIRIIAADASIGLLGMNLIC